MREVGPTGRQRERTQGPWEGAQEPKQKPAAPFAFKNGQQSIFDHCIDRIRTVWPVLVCIGVVRLYWTRGYQRCPREVLISQGIHPHPGPEAASGPCDPVKYNISDDEDGETQVPAWQAEHIFINHEKNEDERKPEGASKHATTHQRKRGMERDPLRKKPWQFPFRGGRKTKLPR